MKDRPPRDGLSKNGEVHDFTTLPYSFEPRSRLFGSHLGRSQAGTTSVRGCYRSRRLLLHTLRDETLHSGWIVRSFVATMYQLGFDLHAVPSTFWLNKSATGAPCVAQISCCSSSGRSPAKDGTPSPLAKRVRLQPRYGKNIGCRKLLLQTLCCLVGIRAKRRDVNKRCNSRVGAGRRDDRATIGMTD